MTQIRLAAETLLHGRSPSAEAERRSLGSIVDETKRLQQLIDNVLHFSRAERRLSRVRVEPVELRPVVERAAADLAPLVSGRGVELVVDIREDLVVQGNADALRQIVLNLLDNGARYGPDGQTITVGTASRDGHVELWVQDRGPGVPAADRKRVWGRVRAPGAGPGIGGHRHRARPGRGARAGRGAGWRGAGSRGPPEGGTARGWWSAW